MPSTNDIVAFAMGYSKTPDGKKNERDLSNRNIRPVPVAGPGQLLKPVIGGGKKLSDRKINIGGHAIGLPFVAGFVGVSVITYRYFNNKSQ